MKIELSDREMAAVESLIYRAVLTADNMCYGSVLCEDFQVSSAVLKRIGANAETISAIDKVIADAPWIYVGDDPRVAALKGE